MFRSLRTQRLLIRNRTRLESTRHFTENPVAPYVSGQNSAVPEVGSSLIATLNGGLPAWTRKSLGDSDGTREAGENGSAIGMGEASITTVSSDRSGIAESANVIQDATRVVRSMIFAMFLKDWI